MNDKRIITAMTVGLTMLAVAPARAADIGTAFTYQGFLEKPVGTLVDDTCDFRFGLWDAAAGGNQQGNTPQTIPFVDVVSGVFTTTIDFGAGIFTGDARWLGIEVKCTGDASFVTLSPRHELTPAPYSIRAGEGVGGPNALNVTPSGDVGIGTTTPTAKLHVAGTAGVDGIMFPDGTLQTTAAIGVDTTPDTIADDGVISDAEASDILTIDNGLLYAPITGNVGIGTTTPAARLDVNGAARTTTLEITGGALLVPSAVGWGANNFGQTDAPFDTVTISAGEHHSLAIRSDGTLVGWGNNQGGQINVPSGTFTTVAAGEDHSLAIRSDGTLVGWGRNVEGQINVPSGTFTAIAAGRFHGLAVRSDGTLVAWGDNSWGQNNVPTGTFTAVSAGEIHSLAIRSNGTLAGWGGNIYGQNNVPSGTFIAVSAGIVHDLAVRSDGTLVAWGDNSWGQNNVPTGTFTAVAAGHSYSLAIRSDETLIGWGKNDFGQTNVPAGIFTAVTAGHEHCLAIRGDAPVPNPALRLHTNSAAKPGSNTWTIWSDRRLKKNIEPLSGALERLLQLRGVTFQWLDPASQGGITGTQIGLIADEVQRAFPQWVGRDPKGCQTLTVGGFEALTAEALRELRAEKDRQLNDKDCEIDEIKDREAAKDQRINQLEARLAAIEALVTRSSNATNGGAR